MDFPVFDLSSPTEIAIRWGWLLITRANFIAYVLVIAVFVAGVVLRAPGVSREIAELEELERLPGSTTEASS